MSRRTLPWLLGVAIAAGLLLCVRSPLLAADAPEKVASVEGITEYRLDNGLRVLLFPDASQPTVTVSMTVFVGSRHEGSGEGGMAHLLEHMLFKGTPTHPEVPKVLQERGARFNGTTSDDRTNYFETLPASDDNLEFALRLEADRLVNSNIKAEDLASEMTVVRNEFEAGENSPQRVLLQEMGAVAYDWHNYGKATIGNRSDIELVPVERLRPFYEKYYQPDNTMLVVAGRFEEKQALDLVQKYFGSLPRPERELLPTYTVEPPSDGERSVTVRRVGEVGLVGIAYHVPAAAHPDFAALEILSYIYADEPAGRLYKPLIESKKASSMFGFVEARHDPSLLLAMAEVRKDSSLDEVRDILIDVVEGVAKTGVAAEEVDRARQQILKERELEQGNTSRLAVALSNWAAQGDWRLYFLFRDRIEAVTPEQVTEVAKRYITRNNRTLGLFIPTGGPQRVAIPESPDVEALVADYTGRDAVSQGEQFEPTPANIEVRLTRETLGAGVKATFLPKKTRGEVVQLRLTLRYGNGENLRSFETAAELLPELMTRGTRRMSYQELQDALNKNFATLGAAGSPGVATFSMQTKRENLPAALDILRQVLRSPRLPSDELEFIRRQRLADLEKQLAEPDDLAFNLLRRTVNPYPQDDVRYNATIAQQIERLQAVTPQQVAVLYENYLGSQAGELVVVGDFDPAEVRPLLSDMLADWKATKSYARLADKAFTDVPGGKQVVQTPDKANAVYAAGQVVAMSDAHPDYPALVLGNFIFGGGSLSSRLGDRVRQQEGLSYGVVSYYRAEALDERASVTIYAISNPQNVAKVADVIAEELERMLRDGVTEEELQRAKQGYLQAQTVRRTSDAALSGILANCSEADRTMGYYADFEKRIAALTCDDVVQAWRRHIDPKRLVIVTAGDFTQKPEEQGPGDK